MLSMLLKDIEKELQSKKDELAVRREELELTQADHELW